MQTALDVLGAIQICVDEKNLVRQPIERTLVPEALVLHAVGSS